MEKEIKRRKAITVKLEFNYNIGGTDNCLSKRKSLVCSTWHMHWTKRLKKICLPVPGYLRTWFVSSPRDTYLQICNYIYDVQL